MFWSESQASLIFSLGEWRGFWVDLRQRWHPKWKVQEGPMMRGKSCPRKLSFPRLQEMLVTKWITYFHYASRDASVLGYSVNYMKIVGQGKTLCGVFWMKESKMNSLWTNYSIILSKATHNYEESYLIFYHCSNRSTSFCFFTAPVPLCVSQNENKG